MPNEITPEAAIIELNRIRTNTGERPPEIDMAIRAINRCFVKRKPSIQLLDNWCPSCRGVVYENTDDYCPSCGQALDWGEGGSIARSN